MAKRTAMESAKTAMVVARFVRWWVDYGVQKVVFFKLEMQRERERERERGRERGGGNSVFLIKIIERVGGGGTCIYLCCILRSS